MPRLDRLLARELRREKRARKLTPDESQAARKVLADESLLQQFVTEHVVSLDGCVAACSAAIVAKSERPIRDWLRANWATILRLLVQFALSLL